MGRKLVSQMSASELEEYREYMRGAKDRSRLKKREQGLCIACGVNDPPKGINLRTGSKYVTCDDCNAKSLEADRLKGYPVRPYRLVKRHGVKLLKEGRTLNEIARALELERDYVRDELTKLGEYPRKR